MGFKKLKTGKASAQVVMGTHRQIMLIPVVVQASREVSLRNEYTGIRGFIVGDTETTGMIGITPTLAKKDTLYAQNEAKCCQFRTLASLFS